MVQLINETSQSFREGKKWKCNSSCGTRSSPRGSKQTFRDRLASTARTCKCKRVCSQCDTEETSKMLKHSKTIEASRPRQLVRQMATTSESEDQYTSTRRLRVSGGRMPSRQWTTDASFCEQAEQELEGILKLFLIWVQTEWQKFRCITIFFFSSI